MRSLDGSYQRKQPLQVIGFLVDTNVQCADILREPTLSIHGQADLAIHEKLPLGHDIDANNHFGVMQYLLRTDFLVRPGSCRIEQSRNGNNYPVVHFTLPFASW